MLSLSEATLGIFCSWRKAKVQPGLYSTLLSGKGGGIL